MLAPHLISLAIRRAEAAAGTKGVHWDSLLQHWERNNTRLHSGSIALLLAELIQLRDGRMGPDAEKWVHLAMEEHDKHKMTWSLAMDHLRYAKMLRQSAQYERAAEALQTAMHICRDCGADGWVERIGSLTAALPRPG